MACPCSPSPRQPNLDTRPRAALSWKLVRNFVCLPATRSRRVHHPRPSLAFCGSLSSSTVLRSQRRLCAPVSRALRHYAPLHIHHDAVFSPCASTPGLDVMWTAPSTWGVFPLRPPGNDAVARVVVLGDGAAPSSIPDASCQPAQPEIYRRPWWLTRRRALLISNCRSAHGTTEHA